MDDFLALGVPLAAIGCYRRLIADGPLEVVALAAAVDMDPDEIRRPIDELVALGLVNRMAPERDGADTELLAPTEPIHGLVPLLYEQRRRLQDSQRGIEELQHLFRSRPRPSGDGGVFPLRTAEEVADAWVQLQRRARTEVRVFDRPPYVISPAQPNAVEAEVLATGVAYRVIYSEASLATPGKSEAAAASVAKGEQARQTASLPFKLLLADTDAALLYERADGAALLIYAPPLVSAISMMFELLWDRSPPLLAETSTIEQRIIGRLTEGATDDAIARQLGVNIRTVRRHVAALMTKYAATSRFQLACKISRQGEGTAAR